MYHMHADMHKLLNYVSFKRPNVQYARLTDSPRSMQLAANCFWNFVIHDVNRRIYLLLRPSLSSPAMYRFNFQEHLRRPSDRCRGRGDLRLQGQTAISILESLTRTDEATGSLHVVNLEKISPNNFAFLLHSV